MDKKTIKQLIQNYPSGQLQELILAITTRNPSAQQALLDYCQKHGDASKPENRTIVAENQLKHHWEQASDIIYEFDMYGGGPEDQEEIAYDELEAMIELLHSQKIPWETRREILEEVLGYVRSDNSGFSDTLMEVASSMCGTKEEKLYLADQFSQDRDSYYGQLALGIYRDYGEDKKYLEGKRAHLCYGSDYLELADYYEEHGDIAQALQIVQEGFRKAQGRLDEIYDYLFHYYVEHKDEAALEELYRASEDNRMNQDTITELMHAYYKEKGDYGKQKDALLRLVSCIDSHKLPELYQDCRQELAKEDFAKEEPGILKIIKDRNLSAYFDILMEKNETKEVFDYIMHPQGYGRWNVDQGHYFTKRLSGQYPREIVELYWKETASYVSQGKEANYARAVGILKEIRQIMKDNQWTEEWKSRYQAFLEEHRRKKLLLRLLEGFQV